MSQHEKRTHTHQGHEDLPSITDRLGKTSGDEQWKVIQENFNVNEVVTYFAANMVLSHWDGFFNNYFPYHDDCGGIYTIEPERVNMCLPPLVWQTYDVEFIAARFDASGEKTADARMTVRHDGVVIHQDTKLDHCTTAAPEGKHSPEPGPLHLQDHGNPVRFRNIWIVPKD